MKDLLTNIAQKIVSTGRQLTRGVPNADPNTFEPRNILYNLVGKSGPGQKRPTPTTTPLPSPTPIPATPTPSPAFNMNSRVFRDDVNPQDARKITEKILKGYVPKTPDVPSGFVSPLLSEAQTLAEESSKYKIDPAILPLLAISETQAMRPLASGTSKKNPFNVMYPGTQKLFPYDTIKEAIRQYAAGIAGPEVDPMGSGYERYAQFRKIPKDVTIADFIKKYQNPSDNPDQQLQTLMAVAQQLGL